MALVIIALFQHHGQQYPDLTSLFKGTSSISDTPEGKGEEGGNDRLAGPVSCKRETIFLEARGRGEERERRCWWVDHEKARESTEGGRICCVWKIWEESTQMLR